MKNYIWDFDGTLFDTYPAMVDGAQQALKDFGINMDKKEIYFKMKKYSTSYLINESNGFIGMRKKARKLPVHFQKRNKYLKV